jgi:hypothetical protein
MTFLKNLLNIEELELEREPVMQIRLAGALNVEYLKETVSRDFRPLIFS